MNSTVCQELKLNVGRVLQRSVGAVVIQRKGLSTWSRILIIHDEPLGVFEKRRGFSELCIRLLRFLQISCRETHSEVLSGD
jgi:hypothetical protein